MNIRPTCWIVLLLFVCGQPAALRAQLKLGANPASISKSSILELESTRQGLLLPRVPDTTVATLATAPDGTILYFTPLNSLLVRKAGAWRQISDATSGTSTGWMLNGNTVSGTSSLGTLNSFALPFITNNQERMRITSSGNVGIGSTVFDASNPEKLLVDAGVTSSNNAMHIRGTVNNYFQMKIRNLSTGTQSSTQISAIANNGSETSNYVSLGINGSGYVYQAGNSIETGNANDCYLMGSANDLYIVNNNSAKDIIFLTGGTTSSSETMRILPSRRVGIGTSTPSTQLHIKTGTANDGGLRLENLTSASPVTSGSGALGVDANGKVVRTQSPVVYSGGAGANGAAGGTASLDAVTKIWVAEVANTGTGTQTINFPTNIGFTNILSIQVTAKGGAGLGTAPLVTVTSNTTTSMVIRVVESSIVVLAAEALEAHTNTGTRIYIRVEGN